MHIEIKHSGVWAKPTTLWGRQVTRVLLAIAVSAGSVSCAHRSLYFGTKTEIGVGITGTTTAPTSLNLGYDRSEVALIPARTTGETHSVYGGLDYDLGPLIGGSTILTQTFATGNAARVVLNDTTDNNSGSNQQGRLFFATGTKIALNIDFGQSLGQSVPSFLFGYRRSEGTVIPVKNAAHEVNSVYADLSLVIDRNGAVRAKKLNNGTDITLVRDVPTQDKLPHTLNGIRITQRFATGQAAILAASKREVKKKLDAAAGITTQQGSETTLAIKQMELRLKGVTNSATQDAIVTDLKSAGFLKPNDTWPNLLRHLDSLMDDPDFRTALETSMNKHATQR